MITYKRTSCDCALKINIIMNLFTQLTVYTTHEGAELVSDLLSDYSSQGVSVADVEDVLDLERLGKSWDYLDENAYPSDKTVKVCAYLDKGGEKEAAREIANRLKALKENCPFDLGSLAVTTEEIDGDLWKDEWKKRFRPLHIGRAVVVPEWIKYEPNEGEFVVLIGSDMAFGTGEHETTAMCVEYLVKYVAAGDVVLDVGCGSGILGITAAKLGAKKVVMTDIDECAVTAAKRNSELNGVKNAEVLLKNLLDDESVKGDIIACNIMAEALIAFAPFIGKNLTDGGKIILSGILTDRLERVKEAYIAEGFGFVEQNIRGEWSAVVFTRGKKHGEIL